MIKHMACFSITSKSLIRFLILPQAVYGVSEIVMWGLPVTWSTRMREVMILPYWENNCSMSFWPMVLGSPLTYRLASRMEAELGLA